jgi:hypothetical protein
VCFERVCQLFEVLVPMLLLNWDELASSRRGRLIGRHQPWLNRFSDIYEEVSVETVYVLDQN